MSLLSAIQLAYFKAYQSRLLQNQHQAVECQEIMWRNLVNKASRTRFGQEHAFDLIQSYADFKKAVPVRSYEDHLPYINKIFNGEKHVLWPGAPLYFGKTSGTTGAVKYIPVTKDFIASTQFAARYMLANLMIKCKQSSFMGAKVLHISDPHVFENRDGFLCASISAIKSYQMPFWATHFTIPGKKVNAIDDYRKKLYVMIEAVQKTDLKTAVALPVWFANFLDEFEKQTGKQFKECHPDFKVLFVTGMNYEPYTSIFTHHMGNNHLIMENYSATEGNFAFQDRLQDRGMQLISNQGIFYEFIPLQEIGNENPERLALEHTEEGKQYVLVISTNSGLWAYRTNDIVSVISINPYRVVVSGRLNEIFSPFGEHMLTSEAEHALAEACVHTGNIVEDFIIVPSFNVTAVPSHKWYIAFKDQFRERKKFIRVLSDTLCRHNVNYSDLNAAGAIAAPLIEPVHQYFFKELREMDEKKISVQHKQRRFMNDAGWQAKLDKLSSRL